MNNSYEIIENTPTKKVIAFKGAVNTDNAVEVGEGFAALIGSDTDATVILDAAELTYISSSGLRVLLKSQKSITNKIKIINVCPEVYEVLDMTGFVGILDVHRPIKDISIDGCELIGRGANGRVYRLDKERIVKVYQKETPIDDVDRERNLAQRSLLNGIPTAISFDVVTVGGDRYGIVFELLDAESLSTVIKDNPDRFDELAKEYVEIYKQFHTNEIETSEFPSAKDIYNGYIDGCVDWYTEEEIDKLRQLVNSIPDRNTMIHGDYHVHNIMYADNQLIMIDMGDVSYGHPIFDFLATAATQANLVELNPEYAEIHTGMPVEYIKRLWNTLLNLYFDDKSEEEIAAIDKQIRLFSKLKVAFAPVVGRGLPEELIKGSVYDAKINLIPYIDSMIGSINW